MTLKMVGLIATCLIAGTATCRAAGTLISTPGLSIHFDQTGVPDSLTNTGGQELLSTSVSKGFYLLESDNSTRRFDTLTDLGGGEYRFQISGSSEQFTARFDGTNDYMTVRFTSLGGFALNAEQLKFTLYTLGEGVQALALDCMVDVANTRTYVDLTRLSLWETNSMGGFALYEYVNNTQEDDTLLDLWVDEGLPHPAVSV